MHPRTVDRFKKYNIILQENAKAVDALRIFGFFYYVKTM
jgi:hypothetical protein